MGKKTVIDPYTGNELKLTVAEAKATYGNNWQNHLAEADHITPLEKIHQAEKNNPWVTNEDIKKVGNSGENLEVVGRDFNNAKRSRTNQEFVGDDNYLEKKGLSLSEEGKRNAIKHGEDSQLALDKKFHKRSFENALKTGHEAGVNTGISAGLTGGAMSGIMNIVAVIKGEKDVGEAITDTAESALKSAHNETEQSLHRLGLLKVEVLQSSFQQFCMAYSRIKHFELKSSPGLDEISNFAIDEQGILELQEMTNIYESSIKSGVAGASTGALVALAASGSLPLVTGMLSTAGSALAIGQVGAAASIVGSALSVGAAAVAPLAALAAGPVVIFTAFSANAKAEENLEKAKVSYLEAEAAAEKIKTSQLMCEAIAKRTDMFFALLLELNEMFSYCTGLLDALTIKKMGFRGKKEVDGREFNEKEIALIAVTRSLAGAIKAIIDTAILGEDGNLTPESETLANGGSEMITTHGESVVLVKSSRLGVKPKALPKSAFSVDKRKSRDFELLRTIGGGVLGVAAAVLVAKYIAPNLSWLVAITLIATAFSTPVLLIMKVQNVEKISVIIKTISCVLLTGELCVLVYFTCTRWLELSFFWWINVPLALGISCLLGCSLPTTVERKSSVRIFLTEIAWCFWFLTITPFFFTILHKWIGFPFLLILIVTIVLYGIIALASTMCMGDI